jgi:oligopeptide/dipeptide ABC transporter ATP-binding protein
LATPLIELRAASVNYQTGPPWARHSVAAVKSVGLQVSESETLGLVGESGSGKTTIGRLCLGLLRPTSGKILFEGSPLSATTGRRKGRLQVVLQNPEWALNPRLVVGSSVAEPLSITGVSRSERGASVKAMLQRVGLGSELSTSYPHELSGGQRQRVSIARALITHPRFIVFDEAVSALDVSIQAQVLNLIKGLQDEQHFGALFISHDLAAVRYVAQRIAVLYAGEIVELAPAVRFYEHPYHPYSRALGLTGVDQEGRQFQLKSTVEGVASVGCPLHPRCPMAIERCRQEKPLLRKLADSEVACHRAEEVAVI